jgi:hypothetical protein
LSKEIRVNRSKNSELHAPSAAEGNHECSDGEHSRDQSPSPSLLDLTRLPDYLIAQGFVETETTYAPDDVETITYHLTDKGLKLLSKLL